MYTDRTLWYYLIMMNINEMTDDQLLTHFIQKFKEHLMRDPDRLSNFLEESILNEYDTRDREDLIEELEFITE